MIGTQLAHFRITAKLGEGGMGEVYLAEDNKLGRQVAVKVLPEAFASDEGRLARFEREARLLATLNHPSIAGIYEVGEDADTHFLVIELADGETLAERLRRGPVAIDEALAIAGQIVSGLDSAHQRGIIHRDLKPGNLMVDERGGVKILDFGLAKALDPEPGSSAEDQRTKSPTMTYQPTMAGALLGTASYMSPEQARGKPASRQVDIWAFGCVLYELLAGRKAFSGDTVTDILAAIVTRDPDWSELPAATPDAVRRLLDRCLQKDPDLRLRDIGDARLELLAAEQDGPSGYGMDRRRSLLARLGPVWSWLAVATFLILGIAVGSLSKSKQVEDTTRVMHSSIQLPEGVRLAGWSSPAVAISPDETWLAFVGVGEVGPQQLYLRRLDRPEAVVVPGSEGAEGPFFSPDGAWVGFGAGAISGRAPGPRMLKVAPVAGGATQDLTLLKDYVGGSWGDDGWIYYVEAFQAGALRRVPAEGGDSESVAHTADDPLAATVVGWPQHLDGGNLLLTGLSGPGVGHVLAFDLDRSRFTDLGLEATFARYTPEGRIAYVHRDGVLRIAPFDSERTMVTGAGVALMEGLAFTGNFVPVLATGERGSLLYTSGFVAGSRRSLGRMVRVDPSGEAQTLPFEAEAFYSGPSASPDGRKLSITTWDGELRVYDLTRGTWIRLPGGDDLGVLTSRWAPDGSVIAFTSRSRESGLRLYVQAADGSGPPRVIDATSGESFPSGFTPDATAVFFERWSPDVTERGIFRAPVWSESPVEPERILGRLSEEYSAAVTSPDGRWVAFSADAAGRSQVFVAPLPAGRPVRVVSTDAGARPEWGRDGASLYYRSVSDCKIYRVSFEAAPELQLGSPVPKAETCSDGRYSVAEDGSIYLLEALPNSGIVSSLEIVTGWTQTLDR